MAPDFAQSAGQIRRRGQVQVREQGRVGLQERDLLGLGLLHLQDQVGLAEDVGGGRDDARSLGLVVGVGDRASLSSPSLDQNLVAVLGELARTHRRQRDPILVGLDLGWNADLHARTSSRVVISKVQPWRSSSANISAGLDAALGGNRAPGLDPPPGEQPHRGRRRRSGRNDPAAQPPRVIRLGERPNPHRPSAAGRLHQMHRDRLARGRDRLACDSPDLRLRGRASAPGGSRGDRATGKA